MIKRRKLKVEELNRIDVQEFKQARKIGLTVVMDNVRSQNNIGSVFRTSDAFRVNEILLCGITATPPQVEIHKTALGAEDSVSWRYFDETISAVNELKEKGYTIFSIEQTENSTSLSDVSLDNNKKYAIVLGHEVHGVQQTVIDASHGCIEIPQFGTKHSLNISVAAGIVIWSFYSHLSSDISE
ncbi:MAG: RNA methyltransferase [Dysgonamonadaceae bacterium]|nr:RNA methyltransferase [Dysgonamonadaceae bacterium]MDD4728013.1 RNA methyltransferase [Dysgonamonadaceae bacterium]